MMRISFIIPHKGRETLLQQTIRSVRDLDVAEQELEIIVVTQNKHLDLPSIEAELIPLKIIYRPEHDTISTLRNAGVHHASGEYLVFLDADIQLSLNWLTTICQEFRANTERVLVSAIQQCSPVAGSIEKIRVTLNNSLADSPVQFLDGRNLFLSRKTFDEAGGFPEHLVTCEDYYFTNKVGQFGEVYFTSKTSYIHLGEDKSYGELFKKEIWRGQSNLRALGGRKLVLRELPSLLIPFWQAAFFLLALFFLLSGGSTWCCVTLIMYCLPVVLYGLRLFRFGKKQIGFLEACQFYAVYSSARMIGTIVGLFKVIRV